MGKTWVGQNLSAVALIAVLGAAGCHKDTGQQQADASDPAAANMATNDSTNGQSAQENYPQAQQPQQAKSYSSAAPRARTSAPSSSASYDQAMPPAPPEEANNNYPSNDAQDTQYANQYPGDASQYETAEAVQPPPPLPEYEQPECPGDNYIWTPGYWNYASAGYYWVPGIWVVAPYTGALWTPGYWGYEGERYRFHHGFWGDHIGFYGGISYGYGYFGHGYEGGYWNHDHFFYNRAVTHVDETVVRNVYVHNVTVNNVTINNYNNAYNRTVVNQVSYNGGRGGINARPAPFELAAQHEHHLPPLPAQIQHVQQASQNRAQFASANQGRPQLLAANRPIQGHTEPTPPAFQANRSPQPPINGRLPNQQDRPSPQQANGNRPGEPAFGAHPANEPRPQPGTPAPGNPSRPEQQNHVSPQQLARHENSPAPPQNRPQPEPARPAFNPAPQHTAQPARPAYTPAPQPQHAEPARPTAQPARPAYTPQQHQPQPQGPPNTRAAPATTGNPPGLHTPRSLSRNLRPARLPSRARNRSSTPHRSLLGPHLNRSTVLLSRNISRRPGQKSIPTARRLGHTKKRRTQAFRPGSSLLDAYPTIKARATCSSPAPQPSLENL